jgi:hypothetical protein
MKKTNESLLPLEAVRALLEQGLYLRDVSRASGWSKPELCVMCKMWNIRRKRGPKRAAKVMTNERV